LTEAIHSLAAGNLSVAVLGRERKDEIGALARTVQYFRDSLADRQALQKDVDAQRTGAEARRAKLETLITDFRLAVRPSTSKRSRTPPPALSKRSSRLLRQ